MFPSDLGCILRTSAGERAVSPAPPLIREKSHSFKYTPYGPLPAREESQTGRPTIPPQASGVLIDLFIHDLSKARRGAGFPNRRPVLPRFCPRDLLKNVRTAKRETRAASSADSRPWVNSAQQTGGEGRSCRPEWRRSGRERTARPIRRTRRPAGNRCGHRAGGASGRTAPPQPTARAAHGPGRAVRGEIST